MSNIDTITKARLTDVNTSWRRVFVGSDPFVWPFTDDYEYGRFFFPTDGYFLARNQYSAIIKAVEAVNEASFLLSIVESENPSFLDNEDDHWSCELPSYEEYTQLSLGLENALYSKVGSWGVLISHELHAIVSGDSIFMSTLLGVYDHWDEDIRQLRGYWEENPHADWLEPMVKRACENTPRS